VPPKLLASTTEYGKRRYKILMVMGDTVTMERAATKFNWLLAVFLFFLLAGVGAVPYILIWAIWGVHRTYRVMLSVSPQGEVQEVGDVLATFDRDRLKAHRIRCIVFGFLFAIVAGIMAIGTVGSLVWPSTGVSAPEPYVIVLGMVITVVLPGIIAFVLFNSARKAARTLGIQSPTAVVDQGLTMEEVSGQFRAFQTGEGLLEIGVMFDVAGLGGGDYGYSAYKIVFANLDPKRLAGCMIWDGDAMAISSDRYCICIQTTQKEQIDYVQHALGGIEAPGLLPGSLRFVTGRVASPNSLVNSGVIGQDGAFNVKKDGMIGEGWVDGTAWTIAPIPAR